MNENKKVYEISSSADLCEPFSTLADSASVTVSGRLISGCMYICLIGINEEGERSLLKSDSVALGEFSVCYEIDPISYAVYSGLRSFVIFASTTSGTSAYISEAAFIESSDSRRVARDSSSDTEKQKKAYPVPKKTLFIGNSILLGMGMHYGMCADAPNRDYFHHVTSYISSRDPSAVFNKLYGSFFEHSESLEAFEEWYSGNNQYTAKPSRDSFTPDTELIIIQLGDNINTDLKYETFKKSGDMLIQRIKESCPAARIIWVHGWFTRPHVYREISELCLRHEITCIDIGNTRSRESEAHEPQEYMTKDGGRGEIKDTWRTHPGNLGMKRIADAIIAALGF